MHYSPLSYTSSPCSLLFLNLGVYSLVQAMLYSFACLAGFMTPFQREHYQQVLTGFIKNGGSLTIRCLCVDMIRLCWSCDQRCDGRI